MQSVGLRPSRRALQSILFGFYPTVLFKLNEEKHVSAKRIQKNQQEHILSQPLPGEGGVQNAR